MSVFRNGQIISEKIGEGDEVADYTLKLSDETFNLSGSNSPPLCSAIKRTRGNTRGSPRGGFIQTNTWIKKISSAVRIEVLAEEKNVIIRYAGEL